MICHDTKTLMGLIFISDCAHSRANVTSDSISILEPSMTSRLHSAFTTHPSLTSLWLHGAILKGPVCTQNGESSAAPIACTDVPNPPRHTPPNDAPSSKSDKQSSRTRSVRRRRNRRPSAFAETIDNLAMKRMGRGTMYYGERPDYTDEEAADAVDDGMETLMPDPVLVTGATGRTGQWIALGLLNQSFNVRCLTRKFSRAESIFGPSGANVDVFEADLSRSEGLADAVDGATAIVCSSGSSRWVPGGFGAVDADGVSRLVDSALQVGGVSMLVLISSADVGSARGQAKRRAEDYVKASGLPYVIFRVQSLSDGAGGTEEIVMKPILEQHDSTSKVPPLRAVSRVDLAQCVCQAIVHHRKIQELKADNAEDEFEFPNCVISVQNSGRPSVPDKRFWAKSFNSIADAFRERDDGQ